MFMHLFHLLDFALLSYRLPVSAQFKWERNMGYHFNLPNDYESLHMPGFHVPTSFPMLFPSSSFSNHLGLQVVLSKASSFEAETPVSNLKSF